MLRYVALFTMTLISFGARAQDSSETDKFWTSILPMHWTLMICAPDAMNSPPAMKFEDVYSVAREKVSATMPEQDFFTKQGTVRDDIDARKDVVCPELHEAGIESATADALK